MAVREQRRVTAERLELEAYTLYLSPGRCTMGRADLNWSFEISASYSDVATED